MRIMVVGSGGREHALAWKLKASPKVAEIFAAPGNPGISSIASPVPIDASSVVELADFAASVRMDLTVVGPELPLTLGIVDRFAERGLRIVGPSQAAAELEGSKVFSKRFMKANGIPTADFRVCSSRDEAQRVLDSGDLGWPAVIKADGLAAGKGVVIAADAAEAEQALRTIFDEKAFGRAGDQVVIERCLEGTEVSFHVLTDGEHAIPLASAQDYKRVQDGGVGPNTGGMGTVSPSPMLSKELQARILKEVVLPTLKGLRAEDRPYRGVMYVGLMMTKDGPMVLEYNCRLGDPETQVILSRLESDLVPVLEATADGDLSAVHLDWAHQASVCVVMAAAGYPTKPDLGQVIHGLAEAEALPNVKVFQSGTRRSDDGNVVTAGGRVLGVTATAPTLSGARDRAYEAVARIRFDGAHWRRDIGSDVLEYLARKR
jgi:phosphoribosylamine--glycine ligase